MGARGDVCIVGIRKKRSETDRCGISDCVADALCGAGDGVCEAGYCAAEDVAEAGDWGVLVEMGGGMGGGGRTCVAGLGEGDVSVCAVRGWGETYGICDSSDGFTGCVCGAGGCV